jgi:PAS domain S-box-containing protein
MNDWERRATLSGPAAGGLDARALAEWEAQLREREAALEGVARRQAFLLDLDDQIRLISDPEEIMARATEMVGACLQVSRVGYGEIDAREGTIVIERDRTGDLSSARGAYPLEAFGERVRQWVRDGKTLAVEDIETDQRLLPSAKAIYQEAGTRALMVVPLVKDGVFKAYLFARQMESRRWTGDEIALMENVAERTWSAVERARIEAALRVSEERFRTIAEALPAFVWILDAELKLTYANERWTRYAGLTSETALGRSWMDALHPDDRKRILEDAQDLLRDHSAYTSEARYRGVDGVYRWHMIQAEPIHDARGRFVGWCGASVDIHDRKVAEAALRDNADQFRLALEAARMGKWTWEPRTDQVTLSDRAAAIFGVAPDTGIAWTDLQTLLDPADAPAVIAAVQAAVEADAQYDVEYRIRRREDGAAVWVAAKGQATRGHDGAVTGMTGVVQDITDRKRGEERQHLLIRELHHRVKNTLATVQAIVGSTARTASSMDEFHENFIGRLVSLAQTHNLLTEDYWQKAPLAQMLRNELGPYDEGNARISLHGPAVELPSEAAVPVGMAIHELTTNAVKHGALSRPEGRVEVTWEVHGEAERPMLHFAWQESGGPPVHPPMRQGFGSRLLQRVLTAQVQADVNIAYEEAGLRFTMVMPLPRDATLFNLLS